MKTNLKATIQKLRRTGLTYSEIMKCHNLSKGTISSWCKDINLTKSQNIRINKLITNNRNEARKLAVISNKLKRSEYLNKLLVNNKSLKDNVNNIEVAKIILAVLYMAEGTKYGGSLTFGNSDPKIIKLYLYLLNKCYKTDINKFRCTIQCRADADIAHLLKFWHGVTKIPLPQFYKTRIDPRSVGKISKKQDYKGVCRLDYFSAHLYNELAIISQIICNTAN